MKTAVACGGTGGHVFPGLAVARELRSRGHEVTVWLAGKAIESSVAESWDGRVVTVGASALPGLSLTLIPALLGMIRSVLTCRSIMRRDRPDVLIGMGSYACVGPVLAARSLGVRVLLHEANVVPGRAVRFLSGRAEKVCVSFEATCGYLPGSECVVTGFPVRQEIVAGGKRLMPEGPFTLLIAGGSQGAHAVNEVASEAVCRLHSEGMQLQVLHLTGRADEAAMRARYEQAGVRHAVHGFLADMAGAYATADYAVCRAGAATCVELAVAGVPAVLVPYPFAARDHQAANAAAMEAAGGAAAVAQAELTVERLVELVRAVEAEPERLAMMREAAGKAAIGNAAERIAEVVEEVCE